MTIEPPKSHLLGDWVEDSLAEVGITQEKYLQFKGRLGIMPDCRCDERKEWLNRFGEQFGRTATIALRLLIWRRDKDNGKR